MKSTIGRLRDYAIDAYVRLLPPAVSEKAPTWPLPQDVQSRVILRWPVAYEWPPTRKWVDQLLPGFRRYVRIERREISQPYAGTVMAEFVVDERAYSVAFVFTDYPDYLPLECVQRCAVVFKWQFHSSGYGFANVLPGGFVVGEPVLYKYLSALRFRKDNAHFKQEVSANFGMRAAAGVRGKALDMLVQGGLIKNSQKGRMLRYTSFLRSAAESAVCVDLPGQGPLCFRLIDYLAIGCCIVAFPHAAKLNAELVDRVHLRYVGSELEGLGEACVELVTNYEERRTLEQAAREFFDRYLHRDQLTAYYLHSLLTLIDA